MKRPLRVVLDTNVVVSALIFRTGQLAWLRAAWQAGRLTPLASGETVTELVRVLAYPRLKLSSEERDELLAEYLPWVETVQPTEKLSLPTCRDPFDVPFLALSAGGRADALVTGDKDLLSMASRFSIPIITPATLRTLVAEATA